ncbi:MAG: DUF6079 family protein [Chthoniobacter sp.]|nr:DUF6079 family protein [Chthoniobacter sp.]
MTTLLKDLITIPEFVAKGDFVLKLTEGTDPAKVKATLDSYVVTKQLASCFDEALKLVQSALKGSSKAAYLHGSFGSGKSHFMAVLNFLLAGNADARSIKELGDVVAKHNEWLTGKKFLMVPFHLIAAKDFESALFKGYTDYVQKHFPKAPYPALFNSDALLANAAQQCSSMGDEKFFKKLNEGKSGAGGGGGWGELGAKWDAASFKLACHAVPTDEQRRRLVSDLVETHFPAMRSTSEFVSIDDGLSIMSAHAKALGFDALILFLDELILWLASHAADVNFVSREAQKLPKLVESQNANRPVPIISFVARQRDLRELVGQHVAGAEKMGFVDVLSYWEGRFDTIKLEDRNLPVIAEKRILKPQSDAARAQIDQAFEQTKHFRDEVMKVLLTTKSNPDDFRKLYPFSPALVETLVAVSSLLQRERTAIKVMVQLLSRQRDTLELGQIIPVGDLFDLISEGDDAFSAGMKAYFDEAKKLYEQKLKPMLEAQHALTFEAAAALPITDAKRTALRNDDRLIKTLLLAALAPEVESLKNMTPQRLAALNHGTIKSFIPGQEANEVLRKCKEWAAHGGALQVQDGVGGTQTISIRITGVDLQPILENAENVDNYGNKVARLKMLVFEALGMPEHQELFFRHEFRWRGTDRQAEVCFGNIREISDDQLEARGEEWKVLIDYPFDRDGHNVNEDLDRLETFRATFSAQRTICWLPSFLNHEAQKAIGTLVRLEHILSENRFKTFVAHLSEQDQAAAKPLLQNQRDQLHNQLRNQIEALYGLRPAMPQYADTTNQLDQADHFQALCELKLKPPVAPNLRDALNGLLNQALEFQNPGHPTFEDETRFTKANVSKVLEVVEQALATTEPSVVVTDPPVRKLTRLIANPLRLGEMHETRFQLGHHWRGHFAQRHALQAGQPVTVAKLRVWIDEPLHMGLPRLAQDLIIRAWAEQTNHSFAIGTASVPPPPVGELQDDMSLREVALPSGDEWKQAVERVKAIFGFDDTSPLVNANNVSVLCAKVRARIEELLPNSQLLEAELDKTGRLFGLEPRSFSRVQTTSEAVVLLKALKNTAGELPFVKALITHQLATKPLVLSHSMKTAENVRRAVETIQWALFKALQAVTDARATSAKAMVAELSDAFTRDEIVVGFQAKSTDLVNRAVELLAATPTPPPLPPGPPIIEPPEVIPPQPPPITKRVRRSQIKEDGIPPWVPEDQRSLALVEVKVPRATGGTEQIVVTGTTARLIEMAGDAICEAGKLRFPKWGCEVEVETRIEE